MPSDLQELAGTLGRQLSALGAANGGAGNGLTVEATDSSGFRGIELRLPAEAARALVHALQRHHVPTAAETDADLDWEARSEVVSEIEGFTGGEPG